MAANNKHFVVFFSVNYNNTKEAERIVLLRQFVRQGFGPDITVITEAVLPANVHNNFFAVVAAVDEQVIATALAPCTGIYDIQVVEATHVTSNPAGGTADYCLLIWNNDTAATGGDVPMPQAGSVSLCTSINLAKGSPWDSILLVKAASMGEANSYALQAKPNATVLPLEALPAQVYFDQKFGEAAAAPVMAAPTPVAVQAATNTVTPIEVVPFNLLNEGTAPAYFASGQFSNFLLSTKQTAHPGIVAVTSGINYLWDKDTGSFTYKLRYLQNGLVPGTTIAHDSMQTVATNNQLPIAAVSNNQGATLAFDLSKNNDFHIKSPLSDWLNDVLHTTQYNAAWPEDNYTGELLAAYNYWLSILPAPPKNGTVPASIINTTYNTPGYPANATFSLDAFKEVYKHLSDEASYFQIVFKWFGTNGIINAINTQLANASSNVLTSVANLMQVPTATSLVTVILDNIFNDIAAIVGAIPEIGSALSAVINITWSTVKLGLSSGTADTPIQESISNMANLLNQYAQDMVSASQTHLNLLNKNWGKLQTFAIGEMQEKISAAQFGMSLPPDSDGSGTDTPPPVPQGYITASANAWRYVIYKGLFATNHTPKCTMSLQTNLPNNPWNPSQGNYNFTWYLPATYNNNKGKATNGYIVLDCSTDAPQAVKADLFGPNSALNADPNQFFMGFNGWPSVLPVYSTQNSGVPPVTSID